MIDFAKLKPHRVVRGVRRRYLNFRSRQRQQDENTPGHQIVERTMVELNGRVPLPKLSVTFSDRLIYSRDGTFHRDGEGYVLELPTKHVGQHLLEKAWDLGHAYLYWMMHCPAEVASVSVTLSDGDFPSGGRFSPSTNRSDVVPIPDPFFFRSAGFRHSRELAAHENIAWADRSDDIVWRGASSGRGTFDPVLGAQQPLMAAQRLELILAARRVPEVDAGLANFTRDEFQPDLLRRTGVLKDAIPEDSWARRKFAIDVDGQTNTWTNLIIRMLLGCCVLKLDSKFGYRQWYYDRLKPWEHYVPVKADASDLGEKVEWLRSNDARAAEIAANAQRLARTLSFEAARNEAVELITTHWRD